MHNFDGANLYEVYAVADRETTRVRANFISSADGAVTLHNKAGGLGSKNDQRLMRVMRAISDIVIVGAGTVRAEGYGGLGLHPDDHTWRKERSLSENPRMAIVTNSGDLNPEMSFFKKAEVRPLVITHANARVGHLTDVADILVAGPDKVEVSELTKKLSESGYTQILCEGGPHLFGSFLDEDLINEVCLTISPLFVGGDAHRIVYSKVEKKRPFKILSALQDADSMLYLRYGMSF